MDKMSYVACYIRATCSIECSKHDLFYLRASSRQLFQHWDLPSNESFPFYWDGNNYMLIQYVRLQEMYSYCILHDLHDRRAERRNTVV